MNRIELYLHKLNIGQLSALNERYDLNSIYETDYRTRTIDTFMHQIKTNGFEECPICFESMRQHTLVFTQCMHTFCDACIIRHLHQNHTCPICRVPIEYIDIISQISNYKLVKILKKMPSRPEPAQNDRFNRNAPQNQPDYWHIIQVCAAFIVFYRLVFFITNVFHSP